MVDAAKKGTTKLPTKTLHDNTRVHLADLANGSLRPETTEKPSSKSDEQLIGDEHSGACILSVRLVRTRQTDPRFYPQCLPSFPTQLVQLIL